MSEILPSKFVVMDYLPERLRGDDLFIMTADLIQKVIDDYYDLESLNKFLSKEDQGLLVEEMGFGYIVDILGGDTRDNDLMSTIRPLLAVVAKYKGHEKGVELINTLIDLRAKITIWFENTWPNKMLANTYRLEVDIDHIYDSTAFKQTNVKSFVEFMRNYVLPILNQLIYYVTFLWDPLWVGQDGVQEKTWFSEGSSIEIPPDPTPADSTGMASAHFGGLGYHDNFSEEQELENESLLWKPDLKVSIEKSKYFVFEGQYADIEVKLSRPAEATTTVDYTTVDGTAKSVSTGKVLADIGSAPQKAVIGQVKFPQGGTALFDGDVTKYKNKNWVVPLPPPESDVVFNEWHRTSINEYYTGSDNIPPTSEASKWSYDPVTGSIQALVNSVGPISFLSPLEFDSYSFTVKLSSENADDDALGVVLAFNRVGEENHYLLAIRTQGGLPSSAYGNFIIVKVIGGSMDPTKIVDSKTIGAVSGAWSNKYTHIKAIRDGSRIRVYCSDFDTDTIDPASELVADLTTANLSEFNAPKRWGFMTWSQDRGTFSDVRMEGIGLAPQYTLLKNYIKTVRTPSKTQVLVLTDSDKLAVGGLGDDGESYGLAVKEVIESLGMVPVLADLYNWGNPSFVPYEEMIKYAAIVFLGTRMDSPSKILPNTTAALARYVTEGGGAVILSGEARMSNTANDLASGFNASIRNSIPAAEIEVDNEITQHGASTIWEELSGKQIPSVGSVGQISVPTDFDYVSKSGTLTFSAGQGKKIVRVTTNKLPGYLNSRFFNLSISNPVGCSLGSIPNTTAVIQDLD